MILARTSSARTTGLFAALALVLSVLYVAVTPQPAQAAVTCTRNPNTLEVLITLNGELDSVTVARTPGGTFAVSGTGLQTPDCSTPATPPATVSNVTKVVIDARPGGSTAQTVTIDMTNGRFEPGVGGPSEAGGIAEIEFEVDLGNDDILLGDELIIIGTSGDDNIRFGENGMNLNGDNDVDITGITPSVGGSPPPWAQDALDSSIELLYLKGRDGNDFLSGQGDAVVGGNAAGFTQADLIFWFGGTGNDVMEGSDKTNDEIEYGESATPVNVDLSTNSATGEGNDSIFFIERLDASPHDDVIKGDNEGNRVRGGAGDDILLYSPGAEDYRGQGGNDTVDFSAVAGPLVATICADTLDIVCTDETIIGLDSQDIRGSTENIIGTTGNDTLTGNQEANRLVGLAGNDNIRGGAGDDVIAPGPGDDDIDGQMGTDTIDFSAASGAITVDLTVTFPIPQNTGEGNDTIAGIENVIGSDFGDTIRGNASGNVLDGRAGNDDINGDPGDDRLIGGPGNDTLFGGGSIQGDIADFSNSASGVTADLDLGTATGEGNDTLTLIQHIVGTAFGDTLRGDGANNNLTGGAGNDVINGRGGNDTLAGEAGNDTLSFADSGSGVTVNFGLGTATGNGNDSISGFENVTGSNFNDDITTDAGLNVIKGLGGNDTIAAGAGIDILNGGPGNDSLDGGAGSDTVSYEDSGQGVEVNLGLGTGTGDGSDTLTGIENMRGSPFNDTLTGDEGPNVIDGGAGNDIESGLDGDDYFDQGSSANGADVITGGPPEESDTVDYSKRSNSVSVTLDGIANDGEAGENDNVTEVEIVLGAPPVASHVIPEGATHSGFSTFVLMANPHPSEEAVASLTFLTSGGPVSPASVQGLTVNPNRRRTVSVNSALNTPLDVATKVDSFGVELVTEVSVIKSGSLAQMNMSGAPSAAGSWVIPEGASHSGFTTFVTIANPDLNTDSAVDIEFMTKSSGVIAGTQNLPIPAGGRRTINVNTACGCNDDVSTLVEVVGTMPNVVAGMSLHKQTHDLAIGGSLGVTQTRTHWVVAEGATHSGWHTFVLVANPATTAATVQVTYLTKGQGPIPGGNLTIPAQSRRTIDVNQALQDLNAQPDDVSTLIEATSGSVAVESTIQKNDGNGFVIADSVGASGTSFSNAAGTSWLAPEGATHSGFNTFILISTPLAGGAQVDVKFLTQTGVVQPAALQNLVIPGGSRKTIAVDAFVANADVSTLVTTDSGVVVVEMSIDRIASGGFSKGRSLGFRLAP